MVLPDSPPGREDVCVGRLRAVVAVRGDLAKAVPDRDIGVLVELHRGRAMNRSSSATEIVVSSSVISSAAPPSTVIVTPSATASTPL